MSINENVTSLEFHSLTTSSHTFNWSPSEFKFIEVYYRQTCRTPVYWHSGPIIHRVCKWGLVNILFSNGHFVRLKQQSSSRLYAIWP